MGLIFIIFMSNLIYALDETSPPVYPEHYFLPSLMGSSFLNPL